MYTRKQRFQRHNVLAPRAYLQERALERREVCKGAREGSEGAGEGGAEVGLQGLQEERGVQGVQREAGGGGARLGVGGVGVGGCGREGGERELAYELGAARAEGLVRGREEGAGEGFEEGDALEGGVEQVLQGGEGEGGAGEGAVVFLFGGWGVEVEHLGFELAAEL